MKILVTSLVDLKKSQHNRPHQFVKYLSENHEVTVLSINDWWKGNQGDLESYSSEFEFLSKIDYHYLTERKISPFLQEVLLTKKVRELSNLDFDVHLNYNSLITGYRISRHFNTVFDIADDIPGMIRQSPQIPRILRPLAGFMGDYYLKRNFKIAKQVTLTTSELKDNNKIANEKTQIIPNGVNTSKFKNDKHSKKNLGLEGFILGYVGVLREWVNLKPVFKALKYLDEDIKLLIVGSEGRFKENKKLCKKYNLYDRVIFTGMVPYSHIPKYISAMDVGLIPFNLDIVAHNALPLKLFEYMSCEKPVISTELNPIKLSFPENVLYVSDTRDYIEKIKMLYNDENLRQKLGIDGRKIAKNYNWQNITANMEKILIKVAQE